MKEFNCGNCPLDPCHLDSPDCELLLKILEHFQAMSDLVEAQEYASS